MLKILRKDRQYCTMQVWNTTFAIKVILPRFILLNKIMQQVNGRFVDILSGKSGKLAKKRKKKGVNNFSKTNKQHQKTNKNQKKNDKGVDTVSSPHFFTTEIRKHTSDESLRVGVLDHQHDQLSRLEKKPFNVYM